MRMEPLETLIFTWQMEKQECTITKGRQEAKKKNKTTKKTPVKMRTVNGQWQNTQQYQANKDQRAFWQLKSCH